MIPQKDIEELNEIISLNNEKIKDDMKIFTTRLFEGINKEDLDRMKAYCQIFEKNIRLMKEELDDQD